MDRKFSFAFGESYHIYNRGVDKKEIFASRSDYERFLVLLYACNSEKGIELKMIRKGREFEHNRGKCLVDIGAWCLMPNHFHILIRVSEDSPRNVSTFMKKVQTGYSMYFNKKYERSGCLFEGPFKAEHAMDDIYLRYLFSYIHLNPVKLIDSRWKIDGPKDIKMTEKYIDSYSYSSFVDYKCGFQRRESGILNCLAFPDYFSSKTLFDSHIKDFLNYQ